MSDILSMSDEDIAKLNGPPEEQAEEPATPGSEAEPAAEPAAAEPVVDGGPEPDADAEAPTEGGEAEAADEDDTGGDKSEEGDKPSADTTPEAKTPETGGKEPKAEPVTPAQTEPVVESKHFQVPTVIKANGKDLEIKSEAEAVALMQMGANYTKKLQDLQPQRKLIMMLENNGLLDEGKLSFLIDLEKKNPDAIKKLIKDSGLDPLDIDVSEASGYQAGSHAVSDTEADFRTVMDDLVSTPEGKETAIEINTSWDDTSKEALWNSPKIMTAIHEQRENGVYATIKAEVDRRVKVGTIPVNTPFLEAYTIVGDEMVAQSTQSQGGQGGQAGTTPAGEKTPQVIATRAAAPKSTLANGDKANATSPTKSSPKSAKVFVNPLAQSDEEFMKQMEGRL